jgi:hypothetical protein
MTDVSAARLGIQHADRLPPQTALPVGAPAGSPNRTGDAPRVEGVAFVTHIHPALAEPLLLLALAGWLRLVSGLG